MIITEYIQTAHEFLDKSDQYFSEGDELQGSKKMWAAAAHAAMALSQQRDWNYGDHRSLRVAVRRIAEEQDDPLLEAAFSIAEKFHTNVHHDFMQDYQFDRARPAVHHFVQRIQTLIASE